MTNATTAPRRQVKAYSAEVKQEGDRRFRFTISTTGLDRQADRITGWDLAAFRSNPVVLFGHDHRSPIDRAEATTFDGDALRSVAAFPPPGTSAVSDTVAALLAEDVLRAASVGFIPIDWERNQEGGFDFGRAELLEWSVVSVPANAAALADRAKSLGLDPSPLLEARERGFEACRDGRCAPAESAGARIAAGAQRQLDVDALADRIAAAVTPIALDRVDRIFTARTGRLPDRPGARVGGAR